MENWSITENWGHIGALCLQYRPSFMSQIPGFIGRRGRKHCMYLSEKVHKVRAWTGLCPRPCLHSLAICQKVYLYRSPFMPIRVYFCCVYKLLSTSLKKLFHFDISGMIYLKGEKKLFCARSSYAAMISSAR